jgi:hypothetical protein
MEADTPKKLDERAAVSGRGKIYVLAYEPFDGHSSVQNRDSAMSLVPLTRKTHPLLKKLACL